MARTGAALSRSHRRPRLRPGARGRHVLRDIPGSGQPRGGSTALPAGSKDSDGMSRWGQKPGDRRGVSPVLERGQRAGDVSQDQENVPSVPRFLALVLLAAFHAIVLLAAFFAPYPF